MPHLKRLSYLLIISVALNIVFGASFFYFLIRELPPQPYFESKPAEASERSPSMAIERSNLEVLYFFRTLPFEYLVSKLQNKQLVENGYTLRDLALATLTTFHHFDLERALSNKPLQKRTIPFGKTRSGTPFDLTIYPGLTDQEYDSIIQFAQTEKWPLNSRGLYRLLRTKKGTHEPSLAEAFYLTPEFLAVEMLFLRSGTPVRRSDLLKVLCEGNWNMLLTFSEQQKSLQDLSPSKRQNFLIDYIQHRSLTATRLLLKSDLEFAEKKLSDAVVIKILELLKDRSPEALHFVNAIVKSPRSDKVRQKAESLLGKKKG